MWGRKRKPEPEVRGPVVPEGHEATLFRRGTLSWIQCGCSLWLPARKTGEDTYDMAQWEWHIKQVLAGNV